MLGQSQPQPTVAFVNEVQRPRRTPPLEDDGLHPSARADHAMVIQLRNAGNARRLAGILQVRFCDACRGPMRANVLDDRCSRQKNVAVCELRAESSTDQRRHRPPGDDPCRVAGGDVGHPCERRDVNELNFRSTLQVARDRTSILPKSGGGERERHIHSVTT